MTTRRYHVETWTAAGEPKNGCRNAASPYDAQYKAAARRWGKVQLLPNFEQGPQGPRLIAERSTVLDFEGVTKLGWVYAYPVNG